MPSSKTYHFLNEVISHVKFPFDRKKIRAEIEAHILDRIDDYVNEGYSNEDAEELAVNAMGDAKEIGVEMNKIHNPVVGWIWKITNIIVLLLLVYFVYAFFLPKIIHSFENNPLDDIPKDNIVYHMDIDEKVKIDDKVVYFTDIVYEKDGTMNIAYSSRHSYFTAEWISNYIGEFSDDLGNNYFKGGSYHGADLITSYSVRTLSNFSKEASELIIDYNQFNRKYRIIIPLEVGVDNE